MGAEPLVLAFGVVFAGPQRCRERSGDWCLLPASYGDNHGKHPTPTICKETAAVLPLLMWFPHTHPLGSAI